MSNEVLRIAFLDVGQGDSTVAVLPDNSTAIVVDCPKAKIAVDYLETRGVTSLSHVFLTHTDSDHIGGIVQLLANFRQFGSVDVLAWNIDTPRVREGRRRTILRRLLELRQQCDMKLEGLRTGGQYVVQNLIIDVLHPDLSDLYESQVNDNPNDASVVLKLRFDKHQILLTGDIQAQGWLWIKDRNTDLSADILKFPHHGAWYEPKSKQPSLVEVFSLIDPRVVVISVGSDNRYGHPHSKTIELLCSSPEVMFAHTQPTGRCYSILRFRRGPFSCSGTVEALFSNGKVQITGESTIELS